MLLYFAKLLVTGIFLEFFWIIKTFLWFNRKKSKLGNFLKNLKKFFLKIQNFIELENYSKSYKTKKKQGPIFFLKLEKFWSILFKLYPYCMQTLFWGVRSDYGTSWWSQKPKFPVSSSQYVSYDKNQVFTDLGTQYWCIILRTYKNQQKKHLKKKM